jgi:hypothetical protein
MMRKGNREIGAFSLGKQDHLAQWWNFLAALEIGMSSVQAQHYRAAHCPIRTHEKTQNSAARILSNLNASNLRLLRFDLHPFIIFRKNRLDNTAQNAQRSCQRGSKVLKFPADVVWLSRQSPNCSISGAKVVAARWTS